MTAHLMGVHELTFAVYMYCTITYYWEFTFLKDLSLALHKYSGKYRVTRLSRLSPMDQHCCMT